MFNPTHQLVSRSRKVPVMLRPKRDGFLVFTESEWEQQRQPAFSVHPKMGIYCQGIQVIGYRLEPIEQASHSNEQLAASASA
ncbi:MAG: hypothetical protein AAGF66_14060 [Cyanobacteria bacterium P01_H01_bin.119]